MKNICYNCGTLLTKNNKTAEHIPAKNLYVGFPDDFKINLLTVPACFTCNNNYSSLDDEIRDIIGITNDSIIENQTITRKTVKSIFTYKKNINRINYDRKGNVKSYTYDKNRIQDVNRKNFKGLFFFEYGNVVPEKFEIYTIDDSNQEFFEFAQHLNNLLFEDLPTYKFSGHPSIFKYLISGYTKNENEHIIKTNDIQKSIGIIAKLIYHEKVSSFIIAREKVGNNIS